MNPINNFIPVIYIVSIIIIIVFTIDYVVYIIEVNKVVDVGHFTAPSLYTTIIYEKLSILFKKKI